MYISNVKISEDSQTIILQALRAIGVKHRCKKLNCIKHIQTSKYNTESKIFKRPLNQIDIEPVHLESGVKVEIPLFVVEACSHIKQHFDVEGLFRKAGSTARQREIKAYIDNGKKLGPQHHVVDVANILKLFFRELPEPLLPFNYHDLFLRCLLVKDKKVEGLLLTCLLLPTFHLNTLAYLMEFLQKVANHADANKMGVSNLAIIITPSVMPVEEKLVLHSSARLGHHVEVVEILIRNAERIGIIPENLIGKVSACQSSNDELDRNEDDTARIKKKKRRSGSLTRMLNGLKKMVGKGSPDVDENHLITSTPDFSTPCMKSTKKRKTHEMSNVFSNKKKRDILQALPQNITLANAPCTPKQSVFSELYLTPKVCAHPNPSWKSKSPPNKQNKRRFFTPKPHSETALPNRSSSGQDSYKKSRLSVGRRRSSKKQKCNADSAVASQPSSDTSCQSESSSQQSFQEWHWSGPWSRKKILDSSNTLAEGEKSSGNPLQPDTTSCFAVTFEAEVDLSDLESVDSSEFVRIPKHEYEAIKNRVSAIENRISQEFGNIASSSGTEGERMPDTELVNAETSCSNAKSVQSEYEKTLEESERIGDASTDQLAKRLGKELKIRRSLENKVIRSPSARKIGTIRRRSRENAKPVLGKSSKGTEVLRNMSWHLSMRPDLSHLVGSGENFFPRSSLRRGKPNTVFTGLPQPSPMRVLWNMELEEDVRIHLAYENDKSQKVESSHIQSSNKSLCGTHGSVNKGTETENYLKSSPEVLLSSEGPITRSQVRRASSFHGLELAAMNSYSDGEKDLRKAVSHMNIVPVNWNLSTERPHMHSDTKEAIEDDQWQSVDKFFNSKETHENIPITGRASIAKLRSQNAGMVLARMRLFDSKVDPNNSTVENNNQSELGNTDSSSSDAVRSKEFARNSLHGQIQDAYQEKTLGQIVSHFPEYRQSKKFSHSREIISNNDLVFHTSQDISRGSPKKIGSPRKKYQSNKSSKGSHKKQKLKLMKSPTPKEKLKEVLPISGRLVQKSSSLKGPMYTPNSPRINLTAPAKYYENGKENLNSPSKQMPSTRKISRGCIENEGLERKIKFSPQIQLPDTLKETIYSICTPVMDKVHKMSVSPLKDCNRIDVNTPLSQIEVNRLLASKDTPIMTPAMYRTPRDTPYIKKPLLVKSPTQFGRTPQSHALSTERNNRRLATPLRALPNINIGSPLGSPRRQSPRLLLMKARNLH